MANANLALLTTANTFMDWLITTNNEANSINELRNGNYYKDGGNFTVANGTIFVLNSAITSIQTSGNNILGQQTTMNTQITSSNATFQGNVLVTALGSYLQVANVAQTQYLVVSSANNLNLVNLVTVQATAMSNQNVMSVQYLSPANTSLQLVLGANGQIIAGNANASGNTFRIHCHWDNNVFFDYNNTVGDIVIRNGGGTERMRFVANGMILFSGSPLQATASTVNANTIILDNTNTYSAVQGNLIINNLVVHGNQTIEGTTTLASDTFQLRTGLVPDGDGHFDVWRGTTVNANAMLKFNHTSNVYQFAANDAQTFSTILCVSNVVDSVSNNSTITPASANAVEFAYNTAISSANSVATFANGTIVLANANLNFNNTASINVAASANGTTQSNIAFSINTTMNLVSLNVSGNISNTGNLLVTQNLFTGNLSVTQNISLGNLTLTGNINCAGVANIYQPILIATRELLSNSGTVNSPNTAGLNTSLASDFDLTLGNTEFNSCNLTINSWPAPGNLQTITVILRQPGAVANTSQTSSNVVTWTNTSIKWSNGEVPVLAVFRGKADILTFTTVDGGNTVYGAHSMANVG